MTDITQAQETIAALAAELRDALKAKGYEGARVEFWIGDRIIGYVRRDTYATAQFFHGDSIAASAGKMHAYIGGLFDPHAADAWFDPAHPINQPAVQEAAE